MYFGDNNYKKKGRKHSTINIIKYDKNVKNMRMIKLTKNDEFI